MKRIMTAAFALSLLAGSAGIASAQPYGGGHRDDHRVDDRRGDDHRGGHANWRKGGHIDRRDWNRGARVDYRRHHLRAPPRGYEWRQVDNNYVLAAAATGLIAEMLSSSR